jgi:hypothetical protein
MFMILKIEAYMIFFQKYVIFRYFKVILQVF